MWTANRHFEVDVDAYNESIVRGTGGLTEMTKGTVVTLSVFFVPISAKHSVKKSGNYITETIKFQISEKELEDNSFTLIQGKTSIVYNGNTYRVANILDMNRHTTVQLREITAMRQYKMKAMEFI